MAERDEDWLRQCVIDAALDLAHTGLSPQMSGNVSACCEGGLLVTPSGIAYTDLIPDDLVKLDLEGNLLDGQLPPSSEWQMHAGIYRERQEVGGIVHAHSDYAVSLAVMHKDIPAFHYMVAVAGGRTLDVAVHAVPAAGALVAGVTALGPVYLAGVAGVGLLLAYEQSLVSPRDLSRVKQAFDLNGYVGILYFLVTAAAVYVG